ILQWLHRAGRGVEQFGIGHVAAAGNMAGAAARPWLRNIAFETRPRPCVDHLLGARLQIAEQLLFAADEAGIEPSLKFSGFWRDRAGLDRASFAPPFF